MACPPKLRRRFVVAAAFVAASLLHLYVRLRGDALVWILQSSFGSSSSSSSSPGNHTTALSRGRMGGEAVPKVPRLQYVRPPGSRDELVSIFEGMFHDSDQTNRMLPKSAKEIAAKYGLPETSRDVSCNANGTTTIGWIPSERSYYNVSASDDPYSSTGKIPNLIFQSWKTNMLNHELCEHVLVWSKLNPTYDYFLFDDDAVDEFIRMEYGKEIFAGYACVAVGAAMCDVWRLLVVYLFGGIYFDFDTRLAIPFREWNWGDRDVVSGRSCNAPRKHPGGCAHQWGLVYAPKHPVLHASIKETLGNLAERKATHVYDISFWSYYNGWRNGPYNQSYMPGWGDAFGGRVIFQNDDAKEVMVEGNMHWVKQKQIWRKECL